MMTIREQAMVRLLTVARERLAKAIQVDLDGFCDRIEIATDTYENDESSLCGDAAAEIAIQRAELAEIDAMLAEVAA